MRIFGFELFEKPPELREKEEAERLTLLKEKGLVVSLEEIEAGAIQVFEFRTFPSLRPYNGEVWAKVKPVESVKPGVTSVRFSRAGDSPRQEMDAVLVHPTPDCRDVERVAKRLNVECWDVAVESRPLVEDS